MTASAAKTAATSGRATQAQGPRRAAARRIAYAWIAGLVSAGFTLLLILISFGGTSIAGIDAWAFIDVVIILGLSFGTYRKSRVCAILLLAFFLLNKLIQWEGVGNPAGLTVAAVLTWCYVLGVIGTFQHHRLIKRGEGVAEPRLCPTPSPWNAGDTAAYATPEVFVSHSVEDKPVADAIVKSLEEANLRCWIAPRDVLPGMEYGKAIADAVTDCRVLVVVFSAAANASAHVRHEVEQALSKDKTIVPFRIQELSPTGSMEHYLAGIQWLDALTPPLDRNVARLAATLTRLLRQGEAHPAAQAQGAVAAAPDTMGTLS
jgi:hypothetical protein